MGTDPAERRRGPRRFGLVVWTLLVTIGAAAGLALPVVALVAATRLDMPVWVVYPTIALAGALQGLLLGITQALALHRTVIEVPRAGWSLITMAGALVAWSLGMLPATCQALGEPLDLTQRPVLAAVVGGGVLLLLIVPLLQWLLLRRVLAGAWLWILVEALATVVAVAGVWILSRAVDTTLSLDDLTPSLALGGAAIALAFALVTGLGLVLLAPPPARSARV